MQVPATDARAKRKTRVVEQGPIALIYVVHLLYQAGELFDVKTVELLQLSAYIIVTLCVGQMVWLTGFSKIP